MVLNCDDAAVMAMHEDLQQLRALQSGEVSRVGSEHVMHVDVRVLAATHRDLEAMTAAGQFRQDLYFRLNVVSLELPPLRERGDDVACGVPPGVAAGDW